MKLFIVKATGPCALEVSLVRAESAKAALAAVPESQGTFERYVVLEVSDADKPELLFRATYIE